jgi:hypothetical protein
VRLREGFVIRRSEKPQFRIILPREATAIGPADLCVIVLLTCTVAGR